MKTNFNVVRFSIVLFFLVTSLLNCAQDNEAKGGGKNDSKTDKSESKTDKSESKTDKNVTHIDMDPVTVVEPDKPEPSHPEPSHNRTQDIDRDHEHGNKTYNTVGEFLKNAGEEGSKLALDELTAPVKEKAIKNILGRALANVYKFGSTAGTFIEILLEPTKLATTDVIYNTKGERVWNGLNMDEKQKLQEAFDRKLKDAYNAKDDYDLDIKIRESITKYENKCIQDALVDKHTSIQSQESHLDAGPPDQNRQTSPRPK